MIKACLGLGFIVIVLFGVFLLLIYLLREYFDV